MKKNKLFIAFIVVFFTVNNTAKSQVLISLLFGDKLNTGKIEFGLDGGLSLLNMSNTEGGQTLPDWNLGFYFDFKLKPKNLFFHTGVLVKSKMGTANLAPYPLADSALNPAFVGGSVDRKINFFNVPMELRYQFYKYFFVEGGMQFGLRYTAFDQFNNSVPNKDDLTYENANKDNYTRFDAGTIIGLGYKLKKGEGMTIHADYYWGLVDVNNALAGHQNASALYVNVSIPIGKAKAAKAAAAKQAAANPTAAPKETPANP